MTAGVRNAVAEGDGIQYRLSTLGAVALERVGPDGAAEPLLSQGKVLALALYLAAARGRAVPRERLADLLWGDQAPEYAKGSLRQALYVLRQLVSEPLLHVDRDRVRLGPEGIGFDVPDFERVARDGALDELLALYRGPFGAGLDLGGADAAERWIAVERARLEQLFVEAVTSRLNALLKGGALADVAGGARALLAAAPEHADAVAAAFDAFVACGEFEEARGAVVAYRAQLAAADLDVPAAIAQRLAAQTRLPDATDAEPRGSATSFGREMVGRDAELSVLLSTLEQVREGGVRRILVRGAGGIGKTRLLEEFEARVRLRGARVVPVRFLDGMRQVPFAGLADVLAALAALPGALGISEESAAVLAAQVPSLRRIYRGASGGEATAAPDVLSLRTAIAELLEVVSERRPLVLILDDVHLVDDVSRAVLAAARRGDRCRLVEVWAARPVLPVESSGSDALLTLQPLVPGEIASLFTAAAPLDDGPLRRLLTGRLAEAARGLPQLVLSAARGAIAAGMLRVGRTGWESPDVAALEAHLMRAVSPRVALEAVTGASLRVLGVIALWNRPLLERDVVGMSGMLPVPVAASDVRVALAELEGAGLLRAVDVSWVVAHESVREAMQEEAERFLPPSTVAVLIDYWCERSRVGMDVLSALALLAGTRESWDAARRLLARASHPSLRQLIGVDARALPRIIAQAAGRPEWRAPLQRQLGLYARLGEAGRAVLGATAAMAAIALLWLLSMAQPRLVLVSEPIGRGGHTEHMSWLTQPSVAIENGFGVRLDLPVQVRARTSDAALAGDTIVAARAGLVQFTRLASRLLTSGADDDPVDLEFRGPWYVRPLRTRVLGLAHGIAREHFDVVRIVINGRDVTASREFVAGAHDTLRFDVSYQFTTANAAAYYVVGAAPSWVKGVKDVVRVGYLPTPVRTALQSANFSIYPPGEPLDSGYVAILSGAEESVEHIFSATNWTAGAPVWGDGNDVMELGPEMMERLRASGRIAVPNILEAPMRGRPADTRLKDTVKTRDWAPIVPRPTLPFSGTAVKVRFR